MRSAKILKIHDLMRMDKGHWRRSLLWHGWIPLLSVDKDASLWAEAAEGAGLVLQQALLIGVCLLGLTLPVLCCGYLIIRMFWADGSLVLDEVSGVSSLGSGFFSHLPGRRWSSRRWGHLDDLGPVGGVVGYCRVFPLCAWSSSDCSES